jgi:hypothetical protein
MFLNSYCYTLNMLLLLLLLLLLLFTAIRFSSGGSSFCIVHTVQWSTHKSMEYTENGELLNIRKGAVQKQTTHT